MIVHKSRVDNTGFDSCIELQLVLDTYLLIKDGLLGKPKVTSGDICSALLPFKDLFM